MNGGAQHFDTQGTRVTVAGAATNILALTNLNSQTDGDYEVEGWLKLLAPAGTNTITFVPGGITADQKSQVLFVEGQGGGALTPFESTNLFVGSVGAGLTSEFFFRGTFRVRAAAANGSRLWTCTTYRDDTAGEGQHEYAIHSVGLWRNTGTSFSQIAILASVAATIDVGSYFIARKKGLLA
ncbi:MAG TPA: hypothetical protein VEB22_11280 [Phycisphaerales bacterium]|nr:hypothetical protein [Phycisphaerales bacterium]